MIAATETAREQELASELRDARMEIDSLESDLCDAHDDTRNAGDVAVAEAYRQALELCRDVSRGIFTLAEVEAKLERELR